MSNTKSIDKEIINEIDSDLVNILKKYSVFQLILFSRQKGSPVNYIANWTMSIT